MLENAFKKNDTSVESTAKKVKQEDSKPKLISCLESKKAQQIAIMIQKFRLPIETLAQRIVELKDLTDLDSGVDNLVASCPTAEEIS